MADEKSKVLGWIITDPIKTKKGYICQIIDHFEGKDVQLFIVIQPTAELTLEIANTIVGLCEDGATARAAQRLITQTLEAVILQEEPKGRIH